MGLGTMCIGIGSYKGVFVTKKARCIDESIFTRCHEICGAAMAHIMMTNLAHMGVISQEEFDAKKKQLLGL